MYKIVIDNREKTLIKYIKMLNANFACPITIEVEELDLGDVIIRDLSDNDMIVMERKDLKDLAASIKDGRYAEQSHRLMNDAIHNHNILYIIEGHVPVYMKQKNSIPYDTLQTAMFCLNYYKGFSVYQTNGPVETSQYILLMADKMYREKSKPGFYQDLSGTRFVSKAYSHKPPTPKRYTEVVHKVKKDNLTPQNIGEIILAQIPGISSKTSMAIMSHFSSLRDLLNKVSENSQCLSGIQYTMKNGKKRRISSTAIENIVKYLLHENTVIKLETNE